MKRKWQRVLSWILTLTMLLGTFEGTNVGTLRVQASDIASVNAAYGYNYSTTNAFTAEVEFDQEWDHWGVIVTDQLGRTAYWTAPDTYNSGKSDIGKNYVSTVYDDYYDIDDVLDEDTDVTGLTDTSKNPVEVLDLDGFFTVQAFAYDGDATDPKVAAEGNKQGAPVTFRGVNTEDLYVKLNDKDIYVVNTAYDENVAWNNGIGWKVNINGRYSPDGSVYGIETGQLEEIIGSGANIAPITFAAKQGGSAAVYKDVTWSIVGGEYKQVGDDVKFVPIDGLSAQEGETLCGMRLRKNADGTVSLMGQPDKTITSTEASLINRSAEGLVYFRLYADKIDKQGTDTAAQKQGAYELEIAFWPMQSKFNEDGLNNIKASPLQVMVDRSAEDGTETIFGDTTHTSYYNACEYNKFYRSSSVYDYNRWMYDEKIVNWKPGVIAEDWFGTFEANEGYQVKTDRDNNTVMPQTFSLKNTNSNSDLTNVRIAIVDDSTYEYTGTPKDWVANDDKTTDAAKFILEGADFDTIEKYGGIETFTVKPVEGLPAQSDENNVTVPYTAWLMIYADQLPEYGLRLAKLSFAVEPSYKYSLKVGDEGYKDVDVLTDKFNNYPYIDLGAYTVANDIPDLKLAVTDSDDANSNTASFVTISSNDVTRLPGYVAGENSTVVISGVTSMQSEITIKGSLKPETYNRFVDDPNGDFANISAEVAKILKGQKAADGNLSYKDETNGWTVYLIPLKVQDEDNNNQIFFGKITAKPADIVVSEVVSETLQNVLENGNKVTWLGAKNADPNTYVKEIEVENPNQYAIKVTAALYDADAEILVTDGEDGGLSSNIAKDLWDAEDKEYITIAGGETVNVIIGNAAAIVSDLPVKETLVISNSENKVIDPFLVGLEYTALDDSVFRIIAPLDESGHNYTGDTIDNAVEIKVGIGDIKTWNVETIGSDTHEFKLAQVGDKIAYDYSGDEPVIYPHVVTDQLEDETYVEFVDNAESDTTGLGSWGFSFTKEGQLRTLGPRKEGIFYICISANTADEEAKEAYAYYKINVVSGNNAIIVSGIDDTITDGHAKELNATAEDDANYALHTQESYKHIADDYNFVINTNDAYRATISENINIKNNTTTRIEGLYVSYETKNINEYDTFTVASGKYALKDLARNESIDIPVNFVAPGVEGVDPGLYVQKITISANGVATKTVYVKVNVEKAPYIVPFEIDKDYHRNEDYEYYYHPGTADYPGLYPTYKTVIAGAKVEVGTEIPEGAITLKAKRGDGADLDYTKCNFEWYPSTSYDPEVDGQFALSGDGKIVGLPTHPGTYYMTIKLTDNTEGNDHAKYGYFDIAIIVPGSIDLTVTTKGQNIVQKSRYQGPEEYTIFDGVVKGDAPSARKEFTITNMNNEKTLTGLKVSVADMEGLEYEEIEEYAAGSAAHFAWVVADDQTSIAPGETAKFTVSPFDSSVAGTYIAVIRIEADQIAPIEIPVIWIVAEPLVLTPPSKEDTIVPVGQPFELKLKSTGGHVVQNKVWSAMENNDDADDTLLKKFLADMDELDIGYFNEIKNHASIIDDGILTTNGDILTGAGTLTFAASANLAAFGKLPSGGYMIPEQFAKEDITITINPTPYVYIKGDDDDLNIGKSVNEPVDEYVLRDKSGTKFWTIKAFLKKVAFTFKTSAVGYNNEDLVRPFVLQNDLMWKYLVDEETILAGVPLEVSANILVNGAETKDFEIVSILGEKNGQLGYETIDKKAGQKFTIVSENNVTITVKPAAKLEKGTYTADLVIAGSGIETIQMPLSFTVEDKTWIATVTDGKAALSDNVVVKPRLMSNTVSDNKPAELRIYATGNQPIVINSIVELKDNGEEFADGESGKKFVISNDNFEYAVTGVGGTQIFPCADPANPGADKTDQYAKVSIRLKDYTTLTDASTKVRIYYKSGAANNAQKAIDVEIQYVVFEKMNDKITYTPSDKVVHLDRQDTVLEGYDPANYTQVFTIHNGESGDKSLGLYDIEVTSTNEDSFVINGKKADTIDHIYAGEDGTVSVAPVKGLAKGSYSADIRFKAVNGKLYTVTVSFIVEMNDEFSTKVRKDAMRIASGFKGRLFDTLTILSDTNSDNYNIVKDTVAGRDLFLIDLNPNTEDPEASRFDVFVTADDKNNVIVRKATFADAAGLDGGEKPSTDVTQPTTTLYYKNGDGVHTFKTIVFTVEETVTYLDSKENGKKIVTWYVPYGSKIEDAKEEVSFNAALIDLKDTKNNKSLEGFVDKDTNQGVVTDERILDDHVLVPVWHDHVYATNLEDPTSKIVSGNQAGVEWVWEEDGNGGYKGAKVILTCVSDKCKDPDKGVVSGNGKLSSVLVPATCTVGGYTLYTATYLFQKNGITYMCDMKGNIKDDGCGHTYSFDWDNVRWDTTNPDAVSCNVIKTCVSVSHNVLVDGEKSVSVSADKIEFFGTPATCTEPGNGYYVATFNDADIPAADLAAGKNVVSQNVPEIAPTGHKWTVSSCTMEGSFDEGAKSAVLYLVCENDASHAVSVNVTKDNILLVSENAVSKTYRAQTIKDMQSLHADYTFWNHTEHIYSVSWNWISVTSEAAKVTAIFTCTVGGEISTVDATMTKTELVDTYTWTATAVGPDGKEYVDTKTFDRETGEEITHEHVWVLDKWDWSGTTSKNAAARAIFTCSVSGNTPHSVEVKADITEVRTATTVTYTAKVTGPDNNEYTDVKVINLATGEEITHTDHVWSKPVWDWKGTTSANGVAKATFTCTKTGEEHSEILNATVTEKSRKANKVVYVATVSGPDAKDYKDTCTVTWDADGKETLFPGKGGENEQDILEGAFTVIGVEEEYAYTGARIKPAIRVIDNERDVELGIGTDFTVSYTGKNKIGQTNVVKIKGKGNYAGANAEISFKIIDPKTLVEGEDLAASVKSIAKISDSFVYDGTFKYPASITVNMKDKSTLVFTHDGDGEYSHDGDKTVALSFCNNKNKGTAYVAATGSDGKTKKKAYKIAAADISSAKFEAEEATWAVKAENVKIEGTYGEDDLELVAGGDFKVTYKAKNAGDGAGEAKIAGKGNFKGKAVVKYNVKALDLSEENIIVTAKTGKAVKVTVVDNAGNALGKKLYSYTLTNNDTEGNAKTKLAAGTVTVTVKPGEKAGSNVTGEASAEATVATDISKTKIKVAKTFTKTYTGEEIKLDDEDFAADKINVNGLVVGTDFEVVGYKNNLKKGTMTVTIQGIGEKSGTKTFKVKIVGKSFGTAK